MTRRPAPARPARGHRDPDRCDEFIADAAKVERLPASLIGPEHVGALASTFRVLGDPTRVRMLDALARSELCVCDLATLLGATESAVSHQLRLLRGLRLVRARREGRMMFYALDDQHIMTLFQQGLRHVDEVAAGLVAREPARRRRAAPRAGKAPGSRGRGRASR